MKLSPGDLNTDPYPPTPHKHLYLWSDHHTKGAQWFGIFRKLIVCACLQDFTILTAKAFS